MIERYARGKGSVIRLLARGNFSLTGSGLLMAVGVLAVTTLALAAWLAIQGYWPVLLVALVQVVLVSWLLLKSWQSAWVEERIEITADAIRLERRTCRDAERFVFDPRWARVRVVSAARSWYPPRVWLHSRGREVELGTFLVGEEREDLARLLAEAIQPFSAWQAPVLQATGAAH